ncbi:MAG: DUF885 domain-containing protein [Flavobacteriaceae bacterium]
MAKKYSFYFWFLNLLVAALIILGVFVVKLLLFKPFDIRHFYERVVYEKIWNSPQALSLTNLPYIAEYSSGSLDDLSASKKIAFLEKVKENRNILATYDLARQTDADKLNTELLSFYFRQLLEGESFLFYKYPLLPNDGLHKDFPEYMLECHKLENRDDVENYILRLTKFDRQVSQLLSHLRKTESIGVIPPATIIDRITSSLRETIGVKRVTQDSLTFNYKQVLPTQSHVLFTHFSKHINALPEFVRLERTMYKDRVKNALENVVFPNYKRLIAYFEYLKKIARNDSGVWSHPSGDAYYKYCLEFQTTTELDPEQIYEEGLSEVQFITDEFKTLLNSTYDIDSLQNPLELLELENAKNRFYFSSNDNTSQLVLDAYHSEMASIHKRLSEAFTITSTKKESIEVNLFTPFLSFKRRNYPLLYTPYFSNQASKANLKNIRAAVKYGIKHDIQHQKFSYNSMEIAFAAPHQKLPTFRSLDLFPVFNAGWELYAEQLSWELGFFSDDSSENLGRLHNRLLHAIGLTLDSGIHYKQWTEKEAIDFLADNTLVSNEQAKLMVEDYIVNPGKASRAMIGFWKIITLRTTTEEALGDHFSLPEFHHTILKNGPVPLHILESEVKEYIQDKLFALTMIE